MNHLPRVLLVDDDADFAAIHRGILEAAGYQVVWAGTPGDAWARLQAEALDLVITDLMMDRLDAGFSLARRIKADPRLARVPIIVISGVGGRLGFDFRPQGPEELAAMGADAYFPKPVDSQALTRKIRELLDTREGP